MLSSEVKETGDDVGLGIHIGYHKTASTLLQEDFFSKLPDVHFIGVSASKPCPELQSLIYAPSSDWPKEKGRFASLIKQGGCNLISSEELSGAGLWGGASCLALRERTAQRLYDVFPRAKILIVIREQFSMLRSLYWQYVWEGGLLSYRHFIRKAVDDPAFFDARHLCYHDLYRIYMDLFGQAHVRVLPYEKLLSDPEGFFDVISEFFELPPARADGPSFLEVHNRSGRRSATFEYLRALNFLFPRELSEACGMVGNLKKSMRRGVKVTECIGWRQNFSMNDEDHAYLAELYRGSNRILVSSLNDSLQELGYLV